MIDISDKEFGKIVSDAIDSISPLYQKHLKNMAFLVENEPTPQQRQQLHLRCNDLLFGLYEGVPLPRRGGATKLLPDKITIFKKSIEVVSGNLAEVKEKVNHTIWHEVAHYYGLDHKRIHELENSQS
jgi:predicted Zn-dependent protease with MMP-like domain